MNTSGYVDVDDSCKFFDSQVKKYTHRELFGLKYGIGGR